MYAITQTSENKPIDFGSISVCIKDTKTRHGMARLMPSRVTNSKRYSNPSLTQVKPTAASRNTGATISSTLRAITTVSSSLASLTSFFKANQVLQETASYPKLLNWIALGVNTDV